MFPQIFAVPLNLEMCYHNTTVCSMLTKNIQLMPTLLNTLFPSLSSNNNAFTDTSDGSYNTRD